MVVSALATRAVAQSTSAAHVDSDTIKFDFAHGNGPYLRRSTGFGTVDL
jgi:hypothetical protein